MSDQDLYWRQQAAIKIDKDESKYVEIKQCQAGMCPIPRSISVIQ